LYNFDDLSINRSQVVSNTPTNRSIEYEKTNDNSIAISNNLNNYIIGYDSYDDLDDENIDLKYK
jgi:hypothetical protein